MGQIASMPRDGTESVEADVGYVLLVFVMISDGLFTLIPP